MREALGIDVGGTKIAGIRVDRQGRPQAREVRPTPADDPEAIVAEMVGVAGALRTGGVAALGVGAAGMIEEQTGVLRYAPNIAWRDLPLRRSLEEALGLPVVVDNDANAAAWGEYRLGAGRGHDHMLFVGIGTGIGGGIVSGGRLFRGAHGFAAEVGHVIVDPDGPLCGCGNRGCFEQVASGNAIGRAGRAAVQEHPTSHLAALVRGDPGRLTGAIVSRAAEEGDDLALAILEQVGRLLGRGIAGLANVLDPDVVVIGGGASGAGELLLTPAREAFREAVEAPSQRPAVRLVSAELGNDAGAIGAALLASEATA